MSLSCRGQFCRIRACMLKVKFEVHGGWEKGYRILYHSQKMVQIGNVRREKGKPKGTRQECDFVVGREGKKNSTKASFQPP
jgi:hypothetical protein